MSKSNLKFLLARPSAFLQIKLLLQCGSLCYCCSVVEDFKSRILITLCKQYFFFFLGEKKKDIYPLFTILLLQILFFPACVTYYVYFCVLS